MKLEDTIHEEMSHNGGSKWVLKSTKMSILGKTITTTMMTDLLPDLGKPTIKSIEISRQITGGIRSGCSVPGYLTVSPLLR